MNNNDFSKLCISENKTLLEAMRQLDTEGKRILYVTEGKKLLGTLTDGDFRRHLLRGGSLDDKITKVAQYTPRYIYEKDARNADSVMRKEAVLSIPVVNDKLEIQGIKFLNTHDSNKSPQINLPVVIMAGGKGTRLYPYTKVLPKALVPIGDLPIVEHIMNEFIECGCNDFHYLLNHKKQMIKAYFNEEANDCKITFYDEDIPLGTGGGLRLLRGYIDETFFLTNCDSILKADYSDIYKYHKEQKNVVTMVCVHKHFTIPYGVISMNEKGEIGEIKEKPEYSFLTNTGFYIVEPEVINEVEDDVAIGFPEIMDKLRKKEKKVSVYPVSEMSWIDMGQPDEMEKMRKLLEGI